MCTTCRFPTPTSSICERARKPFSPTWQECSRSLRSCLERTAHPSKFTPPTVTTNFFRLTGGGIVLGRDFNDQDGTPQSAGSARRCVKVRRGCKERRPAPVADMAILSHEYFERRYGGNPDVLGHTMLTGDGSGLVIVGVLAPQFRLYFPPDSERRKRARCLDRRPAGLRRREAQCVCDSPCRPAERRSFARAGASRSGPGGSGRAKEFSALPPPPASITAWSRCINTWSRRCGRRSSR